jgi:hypothetical protein
MKGEAQKPVKSERCPAPLRFGDSSPYASSFVARAFSLAH